MSYGHRWANITCCTGDGLLDTLSNKVAHRSALSKLLQAEIKLSGMRLFDLVRLMKSQKQGGLSI